MNAEKPTSRRRAAPPRPSRGITTALMALVLVAVSVLVVFLSGSDQVVRERVGTVRGELVTHAIRACPDLRQIKGTSTGFDVGTIASAGPGSGGTLRQGPLGEQNGTQPLARGKLLRLPSTAGSVPVLEAEGNLAAGFFGFRTDTNQDTGTVAVTRCAAPRATWWFTGAGATLDHSSRLVMSNLDPGPAVVDVRVFGRDGEVDTIGTKGITIAPGTRTVIRLADIAPQAEELSMSVRASRGRVVAALSDNFAAKAGATPGNEWVPDQEVPSRVLRLAGLPARAGLRTLLIANPSDLEALVDVQVAGKSGSFTPTGLGQLRVAPGTIAATDITEAIGNEPAALRLHSRVPIVATVRSTSGADSSYAGVVIPLFGSAAAPVLDGETTTVQLTAGVLEARAQVTAYGSEGRRLEREELTLKPAATATWRPKVGASYVVVTPQQGSVYGAVVFGGTGTSQVSLVTLPIRLQRPSVTPALR